MTTSAATRILVLACLLGSSPSAGASAQNAGALVETEITTRTGSRGVMIRPSGAGPYPAVLHLHGSGDTVGNNVDFLRLFARAGYVAACVEYRHLKPGYIDIHDIDASLEFLSSSRYVRPGVVALNGYSLGGRLALRVSARHPVRAVSAIAARTTSGSSPTVLAEADRLRSPVLLQHGTDDPTVPFEDAVLLHKKLETLGRPAQVFWYRGAGHNNLPWTQVYERVLTFFRTYLR